MSFHRALARRKPTGSQTLIEQLRDEFRTPVDDPSHPVIIAEPPNKNKPITRLYVIWDAWQDLDLRERSEIIMEAYEAAKGSEAATDISVAMGLTSKEAKRMNIG